MIIKKFASKFLNLFFLTIAFILLCDVNVFSQNRIDSLKYYYKLDMSNEKRYELIHKKIFSHYDKTSDSLKFMMGLNYSLALRTNDLNAISTANASLGSHYMEKNNEAVALRYYYKALKGFETTKNNSRVAVACMSIAQVYKRMEDYQKSFEFVSKAVKLKESLDEKDYYYHGILIHYGNAALEIDDYKTSYKSYKASLEYFKKTPFFRIFLENNLAFYYMELFDEPKVDSLMLNLNISSKQQVLDSATVFNNKTLHTATLLETQKKKKFMESFRKLRIRKELLFKKKLFKSNRVFRIYHYYI